LLRDIVLSKLAQEPQVMARLLTGSMRYLNNMKGMFLASTRSRQQRRPSPSRP
jgi:hypothetical protein